MYIYNIIIIIMRVQCHAQIQQNPLVQQPPPGGPLLIFIVHFCCICAHLDLRLYEAPLLPFSPYHSLSLARRRGLRIFLSNLGRLSLLGVRLGIDIHAIGRFFCRW